MLNFTLKKNIVYIILMTLIVFIGMLFIVYLVYRVHSINNATLTEILEIKKNLISNLKKNNDYILSVRDGFETLQNKQLELSKKNLLSKEQLLSS